MLLLQRKIFFLRCNNIFVLLHEKVESETAAVYRIDQSKQVKWISGKRLKWVWLEKLREFRYRRHISINREPSILPSCLSRRCSLPCWQLCNMHCQVIFFCVLYWFLLFLLCVALTCELMVHFYAFLCCMAIPWRILVNNKTKAWRLWNNELINIFNYCWVRTANEWWTS